MEVNTSCNLEVNNTHRVNFTKQGFKNKASVDLVFLVGGCDCHGLKAGGRPSLRGGKRGEEGGKEEKKGGGEK